MVSIARAIELFGQLGVRLDEELANTLEVRLLRSCCAARLPEM